MPSYTAEGLSMTSVVKQIVRVAFSASFAAFLHTPASADVYKCKAPNGKVEFSYSPCEKGASESQLTVRPNSISSAEERNAALKAENQRLTEQNLRQKNEYLRDKLDSREQSQSSPSGRTQPDAQVDLGSSASCQRAKREYETSSSSIKPNPHQLEAFASSMRAACGMREPDKIINTTTVNVDAPPRVQPRIGNTTTK